MNSNQEEIQDLFDDQVKRDHCVSLADIKEHLRKQLTDQLSGGPIVFVNQIKAKVLLDRLNSEMHVSDNGQPDETKD